MKGMELCRGYWEEIGRPAFEKACPDLLRAAAFGLVGEGFDCFGYDDNISRDHDLGPGFCVWLDRNAYEKYADTARAIYADLPRVYKGFQRITLNEQTSGRMDVQELGDFLEGRRSDSQAEDFDRA